MRGRFLEYEKVHWGVTGCIAPYCSAAAECLLDGEPYCLVCVDALVDRWAAIAIWPAARWELPDVFHSEDPFR